jgi:hypothetical protein
VLGFRQGNDFSDLSDGAGSGAFSGAEDNRKRRRLHYKQKICIVDEMENEVGGIQQD